MEQWKEMDSREKILGSLHLRLDWTALTSEVKHKAEAQLHETEETRKECLRKLKQRILKEENLNSNLDDGFLLKFLRTKEFDWLEAWDLLHKYYSHRVKYPHIYENLTPCNALHVMEANIMNFLPYRTSRQCAIWVSRFGLWDPDMFTFEDTLRFGLMCMEQVSQNPVTQICGVVSILDLRGMLWKHLTHITPAKIFCFVTAIQDSFPLRQHEVHIINNPTIFSLIYAFARPFLKEETRKRIFFHGTDMDSLHRHIPKAILPEEFGGNLGPFQNTQFFRSLLESEELFLGNQNFGYIHPKDKTSS